jgi:hypothetical protein
MGDNHDTYKTAPVKSFIHVSVRTDIQCTTAYRRYQFYLTFDSFNDI